MIPRHFENRVSKSIDLPSPFLVVLVHVAWAHQENVDVAIEISFASRRRPENRDMNRGDEPKQKGVTYAGEKQGTKIR